MIRVIEHATKCYIWEVSEFSRRIQVDHLPRGGYKLTLMEGKGAAAKAAGTYNGDAVAVQAIALCWLHGMKPGSNKIAWARTKSKARVTELEMKEAC